MILSLVGAALLSSGTLTSGKAYIGIVLGIGCAVAYACYFLWTEHQTLTAHATEEMITSGFDLSLYTCTPGRANRVTVRCTAVTNR